MSETSNDQMILRASTLAGVTEFIRSNPAGFGAQVGERGMSLSGGQRQAVALLCAQHLLRHAGNQEPAPLHQGCF